MAKNTAASTLLRGACAALLVCGLTLQPLGTVALGEGLEEKTPPPRQ